ncbi:MAG TPA: aspartate kinase [Ruminiclostridium sp.]|jgi:aspartate kinase|nr:aspartate kinase [Clostridiaceae bacterium]HAA25647.1 aspartate kinase [Ruminiclostridium sp.]
MIVCKFGGTSMASAEQIRKVCNIVTSNPERRLVVVSAPGKENEKDEKVTDMLIALADKFLKTGECEKELMAVVERYRKIADGLGLKNEIIKDIENNLRTRVSLGYDNKDKFIDRIKAAGEDNCARLVAKYLRSIGYDAKYINPKEAGFFLSDEYGNARVLPQSMKNLAKLRENSGIMVFPGFFGYSLSGDVVTFPRGGSDITGSILAAAIEAEVYENFTDVDCVFAASPKLVKNPKAISVLTYKEMRELSYAGFTVLHEDTLEPVYKKGIPVNIRNTNNPQAKGTIIVPKKDIMNGPVTGIAGAGGFISINIHKYMMNREIGFGRKVLGILEEEAVPFEHIPSGIDDISVILRKRFVDDEKLSRIMERIAHDLKVDSVTIDNNLALVMVVGEGMLQTVGVAGRATSALARGGINIRMINQGSSEVSIMFGINEDDLNNAIISLYNEFFS